jgi:hypothetical protein
MDTASLCARVRELDLRRRRLIGEVLRPWPMIAGYLFRMRRTCGNPRCCCAKGALHVSWYLSRRQGGKARLKHVGQILPAWLADRVRRYREYQKTLSAIRRIDREISGLLNQIRDEKTKTLETELEERS